MIAISENQEWHFKILSIVWMLFSVWAIILQTILQKKIVKITTWNHSAGWQREIGLWNVGAVVLIAMHIALKIAVTPILVPVLLVWSGLFGVNHFMSYLKE